MNEAMRHAPLLLLMAPLMAAPLAFMLGWRWAHRVMLLAATTVGLTAVATTRMLLHDGTWSYHVGGWAPPLGIRLCIDGPALAILLLSALTGICISAYAHTFFGKVARRTGGDPGNAIGCRFVPLWLFIWAGLNGLIMTADIFNAYVLLEVLTLSAVGLVSLSGSRTALTASIRYLFVALLGSVTYILGVGILYSAHALLDMTMLGEAIRPTTATLTAAVLMTAGLMVKIAVFPLHFWKPPALIDAPAPVNAALSGLVVLGAFFLLFRLWTEAFLPLLSLPLAHTLGLLGAGGIIWGSLQALAQRRLTLLIAYSTVSQMGYLFLVFPLIYTDAQLRPLVLRAMICLMVATGCAKAAMFLAAGALQKIFGHDDIQRMGGIAHHTPMLAYTFGLAGLCLAGLPPSGGFVAKWMLLKAAFISGQWFYVAVIAGGGLLTVCYVFRFVEQALAAPDRTADEWKVPAGLKMPPLILAAIAALLGIAPWVLFALLDPVATAVAPLSPMGGP